MAPRARPGGVGELRVAGDDQRLGDEHADAPDWPVLAMFMSFSSGWLRTVSGVSPCGTWNSSAPSFEIDRGDHAVGRLHERQPLEALGRA